MSIIDLTNPIVNETSCEYWHNELINLRILLNEINEGILVLMRGGHQSYRLATGQSTQSVERYDIFQLKEMRTDIMSQIDDLEIKTENTCKPSVYQIRPCW